MRKLVYIVSLAVALAAFGTPMLTAALASANPNAYAAGNKEANSDICDCPVTFGNCVCNIK